MTNIDERTEYWKEFYERTLEESEIIGPLLPNKPPSNKHYMMLKTDNSIPKKECRFVPEVHFRDRFIQVSLVLDQFGADSRFNLLQEQEAEIEEAIGITLNWQSNQNKSAAYKC
ncbi:MAG: DUF4268 domain-containing protein, partial [Colwellia sp.]|nr:DUF4268 domain-containing protein [Colwellia sp.]